MQKCLAYKCDQSGMCARQYRLLVCLIILLGMSILSWHGSLCSRAVSWNADTFRSCKFNNSNSIDHLDCCIQDVVDAHFPKTGVCQWTWIYFENDPMLYPYSTKCVVRKPIHMRFYMDVCPCVFKTYVQIILMNTDCIEMLIREKDKPFESSLGFASAF